MKNLTLSSIAKACGGTYIGNENEKEQEVSCVVIDSRQIEPKGCFIATKGERVDGHSFIPDVLEKGASCIVCENMPENMSGNFIVVKDSFQALKDIAEYYRSTLSIPIIGITGSVGKTSTKEFIAGVLAKRFNVLKTAGNFNNEIGVPLMILKIRPEHEIAVLEMGINHFGEMHRLSKMVKPDMCVMTNIGECHLEFLENRAGVLRAKSEIFDYLKEDGDVFVNGDDDMLQTIERVRHKKPVTFGIGKQNDLYADKVVNQGLLGCKTTIHTKTDSFEAQLKLPGVHMIRNALAATAIAKKFGMSNEEIAAGIESIEPVGGRSNIISVGQLTIIDDCYNANPVSVKAALDMLASVGGKTVAVLGDMKELGENEIAYHAEIGAYAIEKQLTALICIGPLAKAMYQGACRAKEKSLSNTIVQYYEALEPAMGNLMNGKLLNQEVNVLVKASHSMNFSKIVEELKK